MQELLVNVKALNISDMWVFGAFLFLLAIRFIYAVFLPLRVLLKAKRIDGTKDAEAFSLLLTFRNQEDNLKNYLAPMLENCGEEKEFVAVDDYSQDNSFQVLGILRSKFKNLKVSSLSQETRYSKKIAQNIAIKGAKHEWLMNLPVPVSVDSLDVISQIQRATGQGKNMVVGYLTVQREKKFFNLVYRIESFYQQLRSACGIASGFPFLYHENNVAFRKEKYFDSAGYGKHIMEPYVNLELILNSFIRSNTTNVLFSKNAVMLEERHIGKTDFSELVIKSFRIEYFLSLGKKLFLNLDRMTKLVYLPFSAILVLIYLNLWPVFALLLGLHFIAFMLIIKMLQKHLNAHKIYVSSLIYDLVMPYYKLFYRVYFNRRSRKNKWRGKT